MLEAARERSERSCVYFYRDADRSRSISHAVIGVVAGAATRSARNCAEGIWDQHLPGVKNRERFADYVQRAIPSLEAAGGRFIIRNMPAKVYEAGVDELTVVLEFESTAAAIAAYESPAYQEALVILGDAVDRDIRIVEGI